MPVYVLETDVPQERNQPFYCIYELSDSGSRKDYGMNRGNLSLL